MASARSAFDEHALKTCKTAFLSPSVRAEAVPSSISCLVQKANMKLGAPSQTPTSRASSDRNSRTLSGQAPLQGGTTHLPWLM